MSYTIRITLETPSGAPQHVFIAPEDIYTNLLGEAVYVDPSGSAWELDWESIDFPDDDYEDLEDDVHTPEWDGEDSSTTIIHYR